VTIYPNLLAGIDEIEQLTRNQKLEALKEGI
jgi:hypothetical protein